ncbi:phage tail protein [Acinetobacter baumannii]|uniref:phage tail protein n=1 Tax=Acinetobacter baumannii TaxID=470 RepID=UPI003892B067
MSALYHSLFTENGLRLVREAIQNGTKLGITHMSFGDGNGILPTPNASYTDLINEVYRVSLNRLAASKDNPNWLEADGVIPSAVGGFNIREVGLWAGNIMVAYANYPPTFKPTGDQGTAQIKTIRIILQIDNTANFELKIDPSVVMATIEAINDAKIEIYKKTITKVDSIADLLLLESWSGRKVSVTGYHAGTSFGGGDFIFDSSKKNINDEVIVFNGWVRQYGHSISLYDAGYKDDLDYGVILTKAATAAQNHKCRSVFIPSRTYTCITTAKFNLLDSFTLEFGTGVVINTLSKVDVHDITMFDKRLYVTGNGAYIYPLWGDANPETKNAIFKLKSNTLSKSLIMNNLNSEWGNQNPANGFYYGVKSFGLNYSKIEDCLFQAVYPVWNESNTDGGHSMGSNIVDCFLHAVEDPVTLVNNGDLGCEGWTFKGGEYFGNFGGITTIDNLNNSGYIPPLLKVIGVHMNTKRFFNLSAVGRVIVSGCDLQAKITNDNSYKALIELEGVQVFQIGGGTIISQAPTTGSAPNDSKPVIHIRKSPKNRISAFVEISDIQPWLYQNAPFVTFEDNSDFYTGKVKIGAFVAGMFTGKYCQVGFENKIKLSSDAYLDNNSITPQLTLGGATFDSSTGLLTLDNSASIGNFYNVLASVVPDGSIINRIKTSSANGKEYKIRFEANHITINHNANLNTPADNKVILSRGGVVTCLSYNSDYSRVMALPMGSILAKESLPASTNTYGIPGQKYFEGGYIYEYVHGAGWLKYAATTFEQQIVNPT